MKEPKKMKMKNGQLVPDIEETDNLSESTLIDLLYAIAEARDNIKGAEAINCRCTAFTMQYEGGCRCNRGQEIAAAKNALQGLIDSI